VTDCDHIITGDGCRIAYRFDGPEDAPILLLSNSLGTHMGMWASQMAEFSRYFRILRYDSRGHGKSDAPAGAYSIDRLGRDVVELLDALAIGQVTFCGLSKGGMVGQWLGYRAPERVARLILCNTSAFMGPPSGWDARIRTVTEQGMTALTEAVLARWFTPEFQLRAPESVVAIRDMLHKTSANGYAGCCAAIRDMDLRATASLIKVPTTVIAGTRDPATPLDQAETIARAISGASLVTVDAAHLSNVEQPAIFADLVLAAGLSR
jgi:3-oxoadipate enol-lactonase